MRKVVEHDIPGEAVRRAVGSTLRGRSRDVPATISPETRKNGLSMKQALFRAKKACMGGKEGADPMCGP